MKIIQLVRIVLQDNMNKIRYVKIVHKIVENVKIRISVQSVWRDTNIIKRIKYVY